MTMAVAAVMAVPFLIVDPVNQGMISLYVFMRMLVIVKREMLRA